MDQMRNHPLDANAENFYKVILNELSNIEAYLKPQQHQILDRRSKISMLRTSLSAFAVQRMIQFIETAEQQNVTEQQGQLEELEQLCKSLEARADETSAKIP